MVEVHVVRDGNFYFYSRWRNGVQQVLGVKIDVDRAREIVGASQAECADTSVRGALSFVDDCSAKFAFVARWQPEVARE